MDKFIKFTKLRILTIIAVVTLLLMGIITLALSNFTSNVIRDRAKDQFNWNTALIGQKLQTSLDSYNSVLYMGRSLLLNYPQTDEATWAGFFRNQDIFTQYPGLNSINAVQEVPGSQINSFVAQKRKDPNFGTNYTLNPPGQRDHYALGILTVSSTNLPLNGFDVFSTPERRAVYEASKTTGRPTASPMLNLSTGQNGMFITLPVNLDADNSTHVNAIIYSKDFFDGVVANTDLREVNVKIDDVTDAANPKFLYQTPGWQLPHNLEKTDTITFGGRTWRLTYRSQLPYLQATVNRLLPFLILTSGFLLASVMVLILYVVRRMTPGERSYKKLPKRDNGKPQ